MAGEFDQAITRLIESRPEDIADPFVLYRELLKEAPVYLWGTGPTVVVADYESVKAISKDSVTFSNSGYSVGSRARAILAGLDDDEARIFQEVSDFESMYISRADGDHHARLRGIAHRTFTPRRMAELAHTTQVHTDRLIKVMLESGQTDFVAGIASRLPMIMINSLLNVPLEDGDLIKGWTARIGKNRGGQVTADLIDAHAALSEFRAYVSEIVEHHRDNPNSTNLVTALMGAAGEDLLTPDELLATMIVLLFGGSDTTTALLGNGLHALLTDRLQWEHLCRDRENLMPLAIEELVRFVTPVQTTWRVTTTPTVIGGVDVSESQTVLVLIGAANRDPKVFKDPDQFDIQRTPNPHIGFWFGTHFCLGAALARLEAQTVIGSLVRRFPDIALANDADEVSWKGNIQFRTIASLDIDFGADRDLVGSVA